jgi:hypothetical protein
MLLQKHMSASLVKLCLNFLDRIKTTAIGKRVNLGKAQEQHNTKNALETHTSDFSSTWAT